MLESELSALLDKEIYARRYSRFSLHIVDITITQIQSDSGLPRKKRLDRILRTGTKKRTIFSIGDLSREYIRRLLVVRFQRGVQTELLMIFLCHGLSFTRKCYFDRVRIDPFKT